MERKKIYIVGIQKIQLEVQSIDQFIYQHGITLSKNEMKKKNMTRKNGCTYEAGPNFQNMNFAKKNMITVMVMVMVILMVI